MKKYILIFLTMALPIGRAQAHTILGDASTLTRGLLDPARVSKDTFTMYGPNIPSYALPNSLYTDTTTLRNRVDALAIDTTTIVNTVLTTYRSYKIVVGTVPIFGANVTGTTTDAFNFAISSAGGLSNGTSATIFVQDGNYSYSGNITTVPTNVNLVFSKGAVITWDPLKRWNSLFYGSGTVTDVTVDITTSIIALGTIPALFQFGENFRLIRPEIKLKIDSLNNTAGAQMFLLFEFGKEARNNLVDNPYVSSFTILSQTSNSEKCYLWHFNGSTNTVIVNPRINGARPGTLTNNRNMIELDAADGVDIQGGVINWSERILGGENSGSSGISGGLVKGFNFSGTRINMQFGAGDTNGIFYIGNTGNVSVSSGNVLQNLQINYAVAQANPTLNTTGTFQGGWSFIGNNIWASVGNMAGGGFTVGAGANNTIWIGNRVIGASACMSDSAAGTKFAGNDNFCNNVEQ